MRQWTGTIYQFKNLDSDLPEMWKIRVIWELITSWDQIVAAFAVEVKLVAVWSQVMGISSSHTLAGVWNKQYGTYNKTVP